MVKLFSETYVASTGDWDFIFRWYLKIFLAQCSSLLFREANSTKKRNNIYYIAEYKKGQCVGWGGGAGQRQHD